MPRKYSVGRSESNNSNLSEVMSVDSWLASDDLNLSNEPNKAKSFLVTKRKIPKIFSILSKSNDLYTITSLIKKDNIPQYLKFIRNPEIRYILQNIRTKSDNQPLAINPLSSSKSSFTYYYIIFLYLSIVLDFESDYHSLLCYHANYNIQSKHTETSKEILNDRTFYVNLLRAVFTTNEDLVFQLILEKIDKIEIFYKRKIIQTFLEYDRINELKMLFNGKQRNDLTRSKGRSSLFINNEALLQNFGKIFELLLEYKRQDLIQGIFLKFEAQKREIFNQMIKFSEDKHLHAFSKIFGITFTEIDFNLLIDHQRYFFILTLGKSLVSETLSNERRFKKVI